MYTLSKRLTAALVISAIAVCTTYGANRDGNVVLDVWPGATQASASETPQQEGSIDVVDPRFGDTDTIVWNVTHPTLEVVRPTGVSNGAAIIIAPGGGFRVLSYANEGTRVADWLAARGFTAFILKYHLHPLPNDPEEVKRLVETMGTAPPGEGPGERGPRPPMRIGEVEKRAIADGLQALEVVRARAGRYGIDPERVGFIGFSAGGVVAGHAAIAAVPAKRPDFVGIIYSFVGKPIPAGAPPAFFAAAADDPLAAGLPDLFNRWREAGSPAELHIYAKGHHGFGTHEQGLPVDGWLDAFHAWVVQQGFVEPDA